jgi:putative aldouronate transport system permease protein
MSAVNTAVVANMTRKKKLKPEGVKLTLLALPFVLFTFAFAYVPLFGWVYAFFNYKPGVSLAHSKFVGLKYFILMFSGTGDMGRVMINTLAMSALGLLTSALPIIFAIMIAEVPSRRFKKLVQTTTTLPNFISWVIVYSLAFNILSTDGLLNHMLLDLHLVDKPTNILGNPDIVWYFQTALGIWKGLGWGAIIYLAAIAGIDNELYDAASVDGAGRLKKILHITLPGIAPTYFVLLLLAVSSILSVGFDQYFVFYNSLVADKIEVLDYYVYRIGLASHDYSYATAIGIAKTFVSLILLFSVNGLSKRVRGSSII